MCINFCDLFINASARGLVHLHVCQAHSVVYASPRASRIRRRFSRNESPHFSIAKTKGTSDSPIAVSEYSECGGSSGYIFCG